MSDISKLTIKDKIKEIQQELNNVNKNIRDLEYNLEILSKRDINYENVENSENIENELNKLKKYKNNLDGKLIVLMNDKDIE